MRRFKLILENKTNTCPDKPFAVLLESLVHLPASLFTLSNRHAMLNNDISPRNLESEGR